ncbi:TfoX/Sxy family protein [Kitasatospora sp. NPDC097643]|uniref:TfoX/Sxy family protein n=1 Tax=Kitasatospora sp. NPDC097643 TaxID=3157230 RepID=UPI003329C3F5
MAYDKELADRIRDALSGEPQVREVKMFGSLAFMVNERMVATAKPDGRIMLRCDPARVDELLGREGAEWAEMRGKPMSKGWIVVDAYGIESDEEFGSWLAEALDYNGKAGDDDD